MRLYTATFKTFKKFEDILEFYNKILKVNNIDCIIDLRANDKCDGKNLTSIKVSSELKLKGLVYMYAGDIFGQNDKVFSESMLMQKIASDEKANKMIDSFVSGCQKYTICLIGQNKKLNNDVRSWIAHLIKQRAKENLKETVYIMHIGE